MTQTFEEYLKITDSHQILCYGCKKFLGYMQHDDELILCDICMKKDYEEYKE